MISVSSFSLEYNEEKGYFSVHTEEIVGCPYCGGLLRYRDRVLREIKNLASEVVLFLIRRLLCQNEKCKALHRELPDIIQPYKHYGADVIQAVLDGGEEADICCADNRTIRRWKSEFSKAEPDIAQRLTSAYAQTTEETVPLGAAAMILDGIKSKHSRWLPFVTGLLINSGHKICTQFAFCPVSTFGTVFSAIKNIAERAEKIVKTIKDTS